MNFYSDLKTNSDFNNLSQLDLYSELPENWYVVIADVINSTSHIEAGEYKQVNSIGVAAITSVLNAMDGFEIPFVFGGDGASFCIPVNYLEKIRSTLLSTQEMARSEFKIGLRVGAVSIETIRSKNKTVKISKFKVSENYIQANFAGGGLALADQLIKADEIYQFKGQSGIADFSGFECRWKDIPTPKDENIALIIEFRNSVLKENTQAQTEKVLAKIDEIYGNIKDFHPLREKKLSLTFNPMSLMGELLIRNFKKSKQQYSSHKKRLFLSVLFGKLAMFFNLKNGDDNWGDFKNTLIKNSDFRKYDDCLRILLAGCKSQHETMISYLEGLEKSDYVYFGFHKSDRSLMTCVVSDYQKNHIHFIDGAGGGYAFAAQMIKDKKRPL